MNDNYLPNLYVKFDLRAFRLKNDKLLHELDECKFVIQKSSPV